MTKSLPDDARVKNLLIIFMKAPRPGTVKTRLQPTLTPAQSVQLYRAMCEDLVEKMRDAEDFELQIHCWPPDSDTEFIGWLGRELIYLPQSGNDLGEKMLHAMAGAFAGGYQKTVIIGSDLPTLTREHLRKTWRLLEEHDAVIGPAEDGGYYLIGLKGPHPQLFQGIQWSTDSVLEQTLELARCHLLSVAMLSREADLDTIPVAYALWERLDTDFSLAKQYQAQRTYTVLCNIFGK